MCRSPIKLAVLLLLFAGCSSNQDAKESRAAFEKIQADVESKNIEAVWGHLDQRSQERVKDMLAKAAKADGTIPEAKIKAAAFEQVHAKMAKATIEHIRLSINHATVIVDRPSKTKSNGAETVDLVKENNVWKIALATD